MTRRTAEQQQARDFQILTGWAYTRCLRLVRSGVIALEECATCDGERTNGKRRREIDFCPSCNGAGYKDPEADRAARGRARLLEEARRSGCAVWPPTAESDCAECGAEAGHGHDPRCGTGRRHRERILAQVDGERS